ncbi:Nucleolar GTP-binding protein 1, partial [Fragariocoptes setiger]
ITVVPSSKDFTDIILSKTQRKTPTVVHRHYKITRIRNFYMRKVKYTQQNFHDRLSLIISEFPKIEEIHPFFADLLNVLYDKDHYKLALGQINTARHLIDNVSRDYVRLLKFGDSLYRCKQLKRAALGRMAKIMSRQSDSLSYLEQVRQHLSRLPAIDPSAKTLLLCGFPNVGKSSFLNKITRADVDVQAYPFTTKSLYVGHTEFNYQQWQVIDTPGILDRPLEERNTIEMQSITALAHLRACILYLVDFSEQCGYSIEKQLELFKSIKPLFTKKPVFLINNKTDVASLETIPVDRRKIVEEFLEQEKGPNMFFRQMSTVEANNVIEVRNEACQLMLTRPVAGTRMLDSSTTTGSRLHVAEPQFVSKDRVPFIPQALKERRAKGLKALKGGEKSERDIELEMGKQYVLDLKKRYDLPDEEKYDVVPELWEGHNLGDFVDPQIFDKLGQLEDEEKRREEEGYYDISDSDDSDVEGIRLLAGQIRVKKALLKADQRLNHTTKPRLSRPRKRERSVSGLRSSMSDLGVDLDSEGESHYSDAARRTASRDAKRARLSSKSRERSASFMSRDRSVSNISRVSRSESCMRPQQIVKARKLRSKSQATRKTLSRKGEADRHIPNLRPRHLLSGKRKLGKTQRR